MSDNPKYTFMIEWPAPFVGGFKRSSRRFDTPREAMTALGDWMYSCFENGVTVTGYLVTVEDEAGDE